MDMIDILKEKNFVVIGDTLNENKYAYKIKNILIEKNYTTYSVGKELKSINDIEGEIDIIDLCINPVKGLELMKECKKSFKGIVIQPGAESEELMEFLVQKGYPFIEDCIWRALK